MNLYIFGIGYEMNMSMPRYGISHYVYQNSSFKKLILSNRIRTNYWFDISTPNVENENNKNCKFSWMVYAEREPLETEVYKHEKTLESVGPYTFLTDK